MWDCGIFPSSAREKETLASFHYSTHISSHNIVVQPEDFGDNWGDLLEQMDVAKANQYFQRKEALKNHFGFINLRVGERDNVLTLNKALKTGVTFQAPRHSLMAAIEYEVFDDLLIGN